MGSLPGPTQNRLLKGLRLREEEQIDLLHTYKNAPRHRLAKASRGFKSIKFAQEVRSLVTRGHFGGCLLCPFELLTLESGELSSRHGEVPSTRFAHGCQQMT